MKTRKILFLAASFFAAAGLLSAQAADPYKAFNTYRAAAEKGLPYPGAPLKGKVVGFANALSALPFCALVENGIKQQLALAGCDLAQNWLSLDNQYNPAVALKNLDIVLTRRPDAFVDYQLDVRVNHITAARFLEAKIPLVSIDVQMPGVHLAGTNNYTVAVLAGRAMARLIRERWGGWDGVDLVVIMKVPVPTDHIMLRTEGVADALAEAFGIDPAKDPKIVRAVGGMGVADQAKASMEKVLAAHPEAVRIALTSHEEASMTGCIAALKAAGRWDPDRKIVVTMGVDQVGQALIRDGSSDAGIAFFPEHYGKYLVPVVAALLTGNAAPPAAFVQNEIITLANIDRWYPKK